MKKIAMAIIIALSAFSVNAEDKVVAFTSLPQAAQQFANANFKGKQVASAQMDTLLFGAIIDGYKIVYTDGTEIQFDSDGNWSEIKAKTSSVPADLVPERIVKYVKANFNGSTIVGIEKKSKGFKVRLASGQKLKFDPNYIFIGLD